MGSGWHREDIKAAIRKRGASLRALALKHSLDPSTMSRALRERFPTYNRVISEFLRVPVQELWPHWYGPNGAPLGKSRPDAMSRRQRCVNVAAE